MSPEVILGRTVATVWKQYTQVLTLQAEKTSRREKMYLQLPNPGNVYYNYQDDFWPSLSTATEGC